MKDTTRQSALRRLLLSWRRPKVIIIIMAAAVLTFLFWGGGLWHTWRLKCDIAATQLRIDSLIAANQAAELRITKLKRGDPAALEEEARRQGLVYEGETITYILSKSDKKKKRD